MGTGVASLRGLARERDFARLLGAQYGAQAADGFAQAVIFEVLVLDPFSQGTPGRVLALAALTLLPYSVLAPFLGVFVDRWDRRNVMSRANYARAALLVSYPLWRESLPGNAELYVTVLTLLGLGRLALTAKGAALPTVLHEHHLLRGNAISSGGGMIAALGGGVIGVVATGVAGTGTALVLSGFVYACSGFVATRIGTSLAAAGVSGTVSRVAGELLEGLREIARRRGAWLPLAALFVLRCVSMIVVIGCILIIKTEYPEAGDRFGRLASSAVALGAAGLGAFLGAVTAPLLGRRWRKPTLIVFGYAVSGAGIVALGGFFDLRALLALTFIGGLGGFVTKVAVDAQVQEALPDGFRGRAFALYDILYNLATVVAAAVIVTFDTVSLRLLMSVTGALTLLAALLIVKPMRQIAAQRDATG